MIKPGFFMPLTITTISESDLDDIVELVREFAEFEDLAAHCQVTAERLRAAMFGEHGFLEGLIARDAEVPIGYSLFFPNFSSFRGQRGFYLDDIYIRAGHRRAGAGEKMLKRIAQLAAERGYERIDFLVLDWNRQAVDFYKKLGAAADTDERHFKFTDEAFQKLASNEL